VTGSRFENFLRWYPPAWQDRYGRELVCLMEDTYGDQKPPLRSRVGIARAGLFEHLHELGFGGGRSAPRAQVRSGSLLVLWAWTLFVVAGAAFAKFSEHWDAVVPQSDQRLPGQAYDTVEWAAWIGAVLLVLAAIAVLPSLVRFLRDGGWRSVRRPVWQALAMSATTLVLGLGVILWAHHLGVQQRNGGSVPYGLVWMLGALMAVATIAACTAAAVAVAWRLPLSRRVLRLEGSLALLLTLVMVPIIGGTLVWWVAIASHAPWFLSGNTVGAAGTPAPLAMIIAGLLMVLGLSLAASGVTRVARSIRAIPTD
jgi:hypothetical protein